MDFWLLLRRLSPPLPRPSIAYMATLGASDAASKRRRPAPALEPLDPVPADPPGYMFFDFHLAGGRPGGDNDELRYSLANRVHLRHKYVGTCNGVILLAPERFDVRNKPDWSCVCVGVSRVRVQDSYTGLLAAGMSRRRAFRRARREARSCA